MSIIYSSLSLLNSPAQTLVNPVNTDGVMGAGLALAFKERYPDMFRQYAKLCQRNALKVGHLWCWKDDNGGGKVIICLPTKEHWHAPSQLTWISQGLDRFVHEYANNGITSVAFPKLGCGNGGLNWQDVEPLMTRKLSRLLIPVYFH